MNINLKGMFFASQFAAKVMIKQGSGGKMINLSSCQAIRMLIPQRAPYAISKLAVRGLTTLLACEWGKYGITVNAIAPDWVRTQIIEDMFKRGVADKKKALALTPMRKLPTPRDVANGVIYLASDEASFVNGHCLAMDGGSTVLASPQSFDDLTEEELNELLK